MKLIDKSANRDLTKGLGDHLEETRYQISRLDQVLMKLGREAQGVQCPAMTKAATLNRRAVDVWSGFPQTLQHKLF